ncbi:nucleotidyltransferase [Paenibacillus sp. PsM32]|uniref:SMODS domain-containing nucleotidyltransferase n=1 Tax=unclassified Paenibacillus TaxID=185978 RepID=UPI0023666B77|nr:MULTISPECIES: nucleotidyltransferase [unclassified Paenibacillus]MDN4617659.1 nucleotidyltransferase [Paenibacillus sp. PsM32]WDF52885.1 nucleotidyltransferase [Paenibacillus sp. KACC 21273]
MNIPTYFSRFIKEIRLTENQTNDLIKGHTTLRKRLKEDEKLSGIIVSTFLQGSYRRATAVRPKGDSRSDVDVIVVTRLSMDKYNNPEDAIKEFEPFMEKHYAGKYKIQGRSIGITLSYVDLDVVITAAPSESEENILESNSVTNMYTLEDVETWTLKNSWEVLNETIEESFVSKTYSNENEPEWKTVPLWIPDRDAKEWKKTDPLAQIKWTQEKNKSCDRHYVNVVKALKWWRRINNIPKYPKGYPLEHLIGLCCPDEIESIGQGVTEVLEGIVNNYPTKPFMADHGVPEHDVMGRVNDEEYDEFYKLIKIAAKTARKATNATTVKESAEEWNKLFGSKFPTSEATTNSNEKGNSTFSKRENPNNSNIVGGRFG